MTISYLEALVVIALALSILMAVAWVVRQRTGNSGWVDTIWTFAVGLVGAVAALWPFSAQALPAPTSPTAKDRASAIATGASTSKWSSRQTSAS